MESINPVFYGSQCAVASYPENCGETQLRNTSSRHRDGIEEINHARNEEDQIRVLEELKQQNRMILTKQALQQSFLYVLAFFLVYLGPVIHIFQIILGKSKSETEWRFWLVSTVSSLGGVFNILIYNRPKVLKLQETYPTLTYLVLLAVIVVSGGEIPSMEDLREALQNDNEDDDGLSIDEDIVEENRNRLSFDLDISIASEFINSRYSNL